MRRVAVRVAVILGAFIFCGGAWLLFQPNSIIEALHVPARYYAKEYCTCIYVLGFDERTCLDEVKNVLPARKLEWLRDENLVRAQAFFMEASARWVSKSEGCRLNL